MSTLTTIGPSTQTSALHRAGLATVSGPAFQGYSTHQHIPALDGVRGFAILLVLITHGVDACLKASTPLEQSLYNVARWGWVGVDLFFVLSGFLITGILLSARKRPHYLRNFLVRRALRIFPLYYATLLVCLVLLPLIPLARFDWLRDLGGRQGWFWLHASNYYKVCLNDPPIHWLSTLWSLAVEEHFYLVWPFVVWKLPARRLLPLCLIGAVAVLGLRCGLTFAGFPGDYLYRSTLTRIDPLLLGSALAILNRSPGGIRRFLPVARLVFVGCCVLLLIQMVARHGSHGRDTTWYGMTAQYSVVGVLFVTLLAMAVSFSPESMGRRLCTSSPLLVFGKYSYALYIFNKPSFLLVKSVFDPGEWTIGGSQLPAVAAFVLAGTLVALTMAKVTWHLVEKPCLGLKRYFEAEKR